MTVTESVMTHKQTGTKLTIRKFICVLSSGSHCSGGIIDVSHLYTAAAAAVTMMTMTQYAATTPGITHHHGAMTRGNFPHHNCHRLPAYYQ